MKYSIFTIFVFSFFALIAQDVDPTVTELYVDVPIVTPGTNGAPPSDAIVLFDGKSLDKWGTSQLSIASSMSSIKNELEKYDENFVSKTVEWKLENGEMVVGKGPLSTKQRFGSTQVHIEWLAPVTENVSGQGYSNSGVFLMGLYEVQILNSYQNETYSNGQASSVYKQHAPLANASLPPGTWQTYDIIFNAPQFSAKGTLIKPASITVFHNGVLTLNNVQLAGPTVYTGLPYYIKHPEKMPLILQDHGNPIRFRNIWIREL